MRKLTISGTHRLLAMFITASCLWLIKLRWSKNKSYASDAPHCAYYQCVAHIYFFCFLLLVLLPPRPPLPSPQKINEHFKDMWISHFLPGSRFLCTIDSQFDWSLLFPPKVIVRARVVTLDISGPVAARMQRAPVHVLLQNKNGGTGRREKLVNWASVSSFRSHLPCFTNLNTQMCFAGDRSTGPPVQAVVRSNGRCNTKRRGTGTS